MARDGSSSQSVPTFLAFGYCRRVPRLSADLCEIFGYRTRRLATTPELGCPATTNIVATLLRSSPRPRVRTEGGPCAVEVSERT